MKHLTLVQVHLKRSSKVFNFLYCLYAVYVWCVLSSRVRCKPSSLHCKTYISHLNNNTLKEQLITSKNVHTGWPLRVNWSLFYIEINWFTTPFYRTLCSGKWLVLWCNKLFFRGMRLELPVRVKTVISLTSRIQD